MSNLFSRVSCLRVDNRDCLRLLQTRIASRLSLARSRPGRGALVALRRGRNTLSVGRIFEK